jgi:hypothetical protein
MSEKSPEKPINQNENTHDARQEGGKFVTPQGWKVFDERWRAKHVKKRSEPSILTRAPTDEEMNNKELLDTFMANRKQAFQDMMERIRQRRLKGGDK